MLPLLASQYPSSRRVRKFLLSIAGCGTEVAVAMCKELPWIDMDVKFAIEEFL
jgi:hypothetical protein